MAAANYITHITTAGERWDLLAWRYYGNATFYSPIIMANPSVPIEPVFAAGLTVLIPILLQSQASAVNLPPWKQQAAQ